MWRRGCPKAWPAAWPVSWNQDEGSWGVGRRDCFSQTSIGNCLLIINVCSDINQYPSLPPTTCSDLEQAIVLTWLSMCCPIALMWLSPTSPYVILWHLPSSTRIHFILQTPTQHMLRTYVSLNKLYWLPNWNGQPLSLVFSCPLLTEVDFQSQDLPLGLHVLTTSGKKTCSLWDGPAISNVLALMASFSVFNVSFLNICCC